jgi:hypothetical protein
MPTLKYSHYFGGEFVGVVPCDVMLDFIGTSPLEVAERASSILQFKCRFKSWTRPSEAATANRTDKLLHIMDACCGVPMIGTHQSS